MVGPPSLSFLKPVYEVMSSLLGWLFHLTGDQQMNYIIGIFIVAALISLFITLITNKVVDQKRMKETKKKMKSYQDKIKEAQKKGNNKEMNRLNKEMMSLQGEMFSSSFKPMLYTMVPIIITLSWLGYYVPRDITVVYLPFELPIWGDKLGWFGWYIMSSISTSPIIKKVLNMEM